MDKIYTPIKSPILRESIVHFLKTSLYCPQQYFWPDRSGREQHISHFDLRNF